MANACERSIATRENIRSGNDLVRSKVARQAPATGERTPIDQVIAQRKGRTRGCSFTVPFALPGPDIVATAVSPAIGAVLEGALLE
jgi:hypothetical protein